MKTENFEKPENNQKQPKFVQMRILDYLHYSSDSLKSDSNYYFHKTLYKYLNKHYPNKYFFYLIYPNDNPENIKEINKLESELPNVKGLGVNYYSTNGYYRDSVDFENLQHKLKEDVDILFCNTPECTLSLLTWLQARGNYVPVMTYSHWLPHLVGTAFIGHYKKYQPEMNSLELKYLTNYLVASKNFNNSKWGTRLLRNTFLPMENSLIKKRLDDSIKPLYLVPDVEELLENKPKELIKKDYTLILFNHRHNQYTGFSFFMKSMENIIKNNPEIKLKIALTSVRDRDMSENYDIPDSFFYNRDSLDFKKYAELLWNSDIIIGAHNGENQWSLSFMDGMFCDCIPLYRREIFFDEMFEKTGLKEDDIYLFSFKNDKDFEEKLISMVNNIDIYKKRFEELKMGDSFRDAWSWDNIIKTWDVEFSELYKDINVMEKTHKVDIINEEMMPIPWKRLRREVLNISNQRGITQYKKSIKTLLGLKEDMTNPESIVFKEGMKVQKQTKLL